MLLVVYSYRKRMHDNHLYNLMCQLVQEQKSLWRMKQCYEKDAETCQECQSLWQRMEKDKEQHVAELTGMIKKHLS